MLLRLKEIRGNAQKNVHTSSVCEMQDKDARLMLLHWEYTRVAFDNGTLSI